MYATVRIHTESSVGSGFHFEFNLKDGHVAPCIITNKHVVVGYNSATIHFKKRNPDNSPNHQETISYTLNNLASFLIPHPDPSIDLCIIPILRILEDLNRRQQPVFYINLGSDLIPSNEDVEQLNALEDIVMVGYPNGLGDEHNNLPIIRKGVTATHPYMNYNGNPDFVIDAACYPGSSGSPVFLFNEGSYNTSNGITVGNRVLLLGVLHSGPFISASGQIVPQNIPSTLNLTPEIRTNMMMNLGFVVKSNKILDFIPLLESRMA